MMLSRNLRVATVLLALALPTNAYAETVADCYEKVLKLCADAMEESNWFERFAVGVMCTGMLAGCNTQVVLEKAL